ncbi:MAG: PEP-CTERM sorting domain-containing protein [Phycisphaerae bacterium]
MSFAPAGMIQYATPTGATSSDLPVSATASFTTGTDMLTVVLSNLSADPRSVGQNLSGLSFALSTGQSAGVLLSSSATERTVFSGGSYSDTSGDVSTGWELKTAGSLLQLTLLGTPEAPDHTILGPADPISGYYDNANSSIAKNNGPHNPFINQSATFVLSIPGLTDSSSVTGVVFSFNTAAGYDVIGVPEPATMALLATAGAVFVSRRGRVRRG